MGKITDFVFTSQVDNLPSGDVSTFNDAPKSGFGGFILDFIKGGIEYKPDTTIQPYNQNYNSNSTIYIVISVVLLALLIVFLMRPKK